MSMLSKMRRLLLGKPKTSGYKPMPRHRAFMHLRDLPPLTFQTIHEMLFDPTIRLGLAMRVAPLCQAEFAFKQRGEWMPGVQADRPEVAKFVHKQITRIWKFELQKILTAQIWGWSAGEVTYRLMDKRVEVDGILHRHAHDVFALHLNGEVKGVEFKRLAAGVGGVKLRFPQAFWHAYDPEGESPYGMSVLKGAYSPWADKNLDGAALDTRRLFAHKDAYGGVDIAYPPGTTNIDGKGEVPNRDIAREQAEQLKAGGVTTRPSEYTELTGKPLWEITRATIPTSPTHIFDYPKDLDNEMLRGMEIPDDVITSEGTGAWQGKQVPMLAFYCNADRWLNQVVRVVVTQILEPLVLLNWGKPEEFEVTTKPLAEQAMDQIRATEGADGQMAPQQAPAGRNGSGPVINVRRADGTTFQRRNPAFARRQMSLDDANTAEVLVGEGAVQASHLVEAGRRLMLENEHKRSWNNGARMATKPVEKSPSREESLARASQSFSLTRDELDLVESLTQ